MRSYLVKLKFEESEQARFLETLTLAKDAWNECSKLFFKKPEGKLKDIHDLCYKKCRRKFKKLSSQMIIKSEQAVLAAFRAIKSNKQELEEAPVKKKLSLQLDARIFKIRGERIFLTCLGGRVSAEILWYPRATDAAKTGFGDPLIFERKGELWLSIPCHTPTPVCPERSCIGVDLGMNRAIFTSEGEALSRKSYNRITRRLSFNKRKLKSKRTRSAKRALKRLGGHKGKIARVSAQFTHACVNKVLETEADIISIEWLKSIKQKNRGKRQNRKFGLWAVFEFKRILEYKAQALGKRVVTVPPQYTSQIDYRGLSKGRRAGARYYGSDGVVLDADHNAACNIGAIASHRLNRPISQVMLLDGQARVAEPNCFSGVCPVGVNVVAHSATSHRL